MFDVQQGEKIIWEGDIGAVTDRRVIYVLERRLLKLIPLSKSVESIPLRHVTSVKMDSTRNTAMGILLIALGIITLIVGIGLILLVAGIVMLIGENFVAINTTGGDKRKVRAKKEVGSQFVAAINSAIFSQ